MTKHWIYGALAIALMSTTAFAAEEATKAPSPSEHSDWTLEKARAAAHKRADELDKMTPEQFAARQEKRKEWRDKWHNMTPEEKEAFKKKAHDKREAAKAKAASDTKPAAGAK